MTIRYAAAVALALILVGCSGAENSENSQRDAGADMGATSSADMPQTLEDLPTIPDGYATCSRATRVGGFEVVLSDAFSSVQGQVKDGVDPNNVLTVETASGDCELLRPPDLFCDPTCEAGQTCGIGGNCVALPTNRSVGDVTFDGLSAAVTMMPREPVLFYNFTGDLPHPAFTESVDVTLTATGGDTAGFTLVAPGTTALVTDLAEVPIDTGTGATVTWTAGAASDRVRVEIELNIANHGGTPGRIQCVADDTGSFTIPADLVDALLAGEASGFPSLRLTRQGAAAVNTTSGCIDLRLRTELVLPVSIPGLVSCSNDTDCDNGQTCLVDLTCG